MPNCAQCGKKTKMLSSKIDLTHYFCSDKCKKEFNENKKKEKENETEMKSKNMIKEIKCTCNECGKVWHYLPYEQKAQKMGEFGKDLIQTTACCCNPIGILVGSLRQKPKSLDQCQNCNSKNVKKEDVYYKKEK